MCGEYSTLVWVREGRTERTSIRGLDSLMNDWKVLARLGGAMRGARSRSLSGERVRYLEVLGGSIMVVSLISYRAVTFGGPLGGSSGVLGLEYPESYLSRSLDERGGTGSLAILWRMSSVRLRDESRLGRVYAEAVAERPPPNNVGRRDALGLGIVVAVGILGGLPES